LGLPFERKKRQMIRGEALGRASNRKLGDVLKKKNKEKRAL